MSSLLLTGGRVIDPANRLDATADVLLRDGRIAAVGADAAKQAGTDTERRDCAGLVVCPGLIDLHAHLREPGQSAKETIAAGTLAAALLFDQTNRAVDVPLIRRERFGGERGGISGEQNDVE